MRFRGHLKLQSVLSTSAAAILVAALVPAAWTQEGGKIPLSSVVVGGLDTATGAKILLIRARGQGCADSAVVQVDAAATSPDFQLYSLAESVKKGKLPPVVYRTAIQVDRGCWCADPDAGLAVMAPRKAVSYRSNQESLRLPSVNERKISKANVPIFGLCTSDEIRVDMRPRREVPVTVWVSDGDARSMAKDDLANLDWILDQQLAGITVRPVYRTLKPPNSLRQVLPACYPHNDEDACCASVRRSMVFDPGTLNLYYGTGSGNFTCSGAPASFVHDAPILGDAAHELSHALGLNQSDHLEIYDSGHTRDHPLFHWNNVMWDQTQFLKYKLSTAQAFWMSQSCGSWFGLNNSCLNCREVLEGGDPVPSSPCPPLSTGAEAPPAPEGGACSSAPACAARTPPENAMLFVPARRKPVDNCEVPLSIYKDGKALEDQLKERYDVLKKHVHGRDDLSLGSVTSWDFLRRWEPSFALNIAPLSKDDPWIREFDEKKALPKTLNLPERSELAKRPLPVCTLPTASTGQ